jgi:hypothetical protein
MKTGSGFPRVADVKQIRHKLDCQGHLRLPLRWKTIKMKKIIILMSPSGKTVYVKTGFNWPAFLFGPSWALVKGLWWHFFALVLVGIMIDFIISYGIPTKGPFSAFLKIGIGLTYMIICGVQGNAWLMKTLLKRGYAVR